MSIPRQTSRLINISIATIKVIAIKESKMKRLARVFLPALALAVLCLMSVNTAVASQRFDAHLIGAQETPPTGSAGTGYGYVILSDDQTTITVNMGFFGLVTAATAGHIHTAPVGVAGPVTFGLAGVPGATGGVIAQQTFAITAPQVADLLAGNMYFNVHSGTFPGGEIRGQILAASCATAGPIEVEATVGTMGPTAYASLTAAFAAINAGTHQGAINVEVCASEVEPAGSAVLNSNAAAPATYTAINIYPVANGLTVSGASISGKGLIELNGADGVTIDGDNPNTAGINRNLTLQNTAVSTITYTQVIRIALATTIITSADNNTFKNLNILGSATGRNISSATSTSGTENASYGIYASGSASTVTQTTAPTAIASTTTTIGAGATANNLIIDNNIITNAARAVAVQGSATTVFPGLQITNNVIGNSTVGAVDGVYSIGVTAQGSTNAIIRGNTVNVESFLGTSRSGLDFGSISATGSGATFEKNKVNRVINSSTGGQGAYGINLAGGNTHIVRNNFVQGVINVPNATFSTTFGAHGIRVGTGTGHFVYHNSVNMTGNLTGSTGTALSSALCIVSTASTGMDVRNNILYNTQTETGAATPASSAFVSLYLPSGATVAMNLTNNNNDYFTGAAVNQGVGQAGTTAGTNFFTLANFDPTMTTPATNMRAYTNPLSVAATNDNASKKVDPIFSSSTDLHITGASTMIDMAVSVGLADDIDGQVRPNGALPDIGADEFYPLPGVLQFSSATYSGNEGTTLVATVNRVTGSAGIVGATYTLANGIGAIGGGACGVGIDYVNPGPQLLSFGDTVTSQPINVVLCSDLVTDPGETFTITLSLPTGGATLGSPTVATATIVDVPPPFNGTYTVGSGGNYPSLTNTGGIFEAINLAGATGNINISILGNLPGETGTNALNQIAGGFTTTIKPAVAVSPTITGSSAGCLINLNGADFVTIDGSNTAGGTTRDMTITNTNTGTSSAVVCIESLGAGLGATNDTVKNTNIVGSGNTQTLFGIFAGSTTISTSSLGADNNNNTIQNNNISKTQFGIYSQGASAAAKNTGNVITQNLMNTASPNNVSKGGIQVGFENNITISRNNIDGITQASSPDVFGIAVGMTAISTTTFTGNEVTNATVTRNNIGKVTNTGTFSAIGISVASATSGTNLIANNFISGVGANGTAGDFGAGIFLGGGTGSTTQVYNNSVSMTGTFAGGSYPNIALAIGGTDPVVDARNNALFATTVNGTGTTYAIGTASATFVNLTSDFNDLFTTTGAGFSVGKTGSLSQGSGTDQATLLAWQTATAKDAASISLNPAFASLTDLHIVGPPLQDAGTTIAAITNDFDGDTRPQGAAYDIGADELVIASGSLQLSSATYSGNEGTTLVATVNRVSGSTGTVGVTYTLANGIGAIGGAACGVGIDYVNPGPQLLSFGNTVTSQPINVVLCSDLVTDPGETFTITLSLPTGGASLGSPTVATATIIDVPPPLNGPYTVGSGGNFPSLTNPGGIFDALNLSGAAGNITINITTDLAGETGSIALNEIVGGFTVLIKPSGAARTINGTGATNLIKLSGADGVTIDGSLSGGTDQSLTLTDTAAGTLVWIGTNATSGANNNTVKNCILIGAGSFTGQGILASSGTTSGGAAEFPNSNNTIQNNVIKSVQNAVFTIGNATTLDQNWVITQNFFGSPAAVAAEKLSFRGVLVSNSANFTISRNTISGISSSTSTSATMSGIQISGNINGGSILRNLIRDIRQNNTVGWGSNGIGLYAATTVSNVLVANNFISDVASVGFNGVTEGDNGYGIMVNSGGGYTLGYNSVSMSTNQTAAGSITMAMNIAAAVTTAGTLDVRDNIFANTETVGTVYGVYDASTAGIFSAINFNDYFAANVGFLTAAQVTLANWQTATGQDAASVSVDPLFSSPAANLHIGPTSPVRNIGTPLGVTDDFDGQLRPNPGDARPLLVQVDIGGDEFYAPTAAGVSLGGRVLTADGRGIRNATVVVTGNSLLITRYVKTGSFGYYTVDGLRAGETYIVTINSKRFTFQTPSRVVSLLDNLTDVDFVADP